MRSGVSSWSGKISTAYFQNAFLIASRSARAERLREIDVADLGGEARRDGVDRDGHAGQLLGEAHQRGLRIVAEHALTARGPKCIQLCRHLERLRFLPHVLPVSETAGATAALSRSSPAAAPRRCLPTSSARRAAHSRTGSAARSAPSTTRACRAVADVARRLERARRRRSLHRTSPTRSMRSTPRS